MHSLLDSAEDRTDSFPSLSAHSGRVRFGVRGNAVWEWRTENGGYSSDVDTLRIWKLQATNLEIEQAAPATKLPDISELSLVEDAQSINAFNPYEHPVEKNDLDPYQARAKIAGLPHEPKMQERQRKPIKNLKAYGEWLEMKRRLAEAEDDDDQS